MNNKVMQSVTVMLIAVLYWGMLLAEYHSKIRPEMEQSCIQGVSGGIVNVLGGGIMDYSE